MKKIPDFMMKDDGWFERKPERQKESSQKRKPQLLTTEEFFEHIEPGWLVRVIDVGIVITLLILLYLIFGGYV